MTSEVKKLKDIISLDSELNKIQDVDILLERILLEARRVVNADAGSIYVKRGDELVITYAQNDTKQKELPPGEKLIYNIFTVPINEKTISGYAAATGTAVNVPDVYNLPKNAPYGYNPSFDRIAKYKTQSTLAIPLKSNTGDLLGVIQVINSKNGRGEVVPFSKDDEMVVMH
ncbi:GAF domain-containing protein, partial [Salinispira pacifica]